MTTLSLPDGNVLWLEEAPKGLQLTPVLGGARLDLSVRIWASQAATRTDHLLAATLLVGDSPNTGLRELTRLSVDQVVTTLTRPSQIIFTGRVSAQALREAEEIRGGGPLWLVLRDLRATSVGGDPAPAGFAQATGTDLIIEVYAEEWSTQLEKVTPSSYVDVMVPVTDDAELATAAGRLRTARGYIRRGVFGAVAVELRQALDPVRDHYDTESLARGARAKKARERGVEERWALTVEDAYSLLSAFIHDDEEAIAGAVLDRAMAVNLLADVAGKVHRLAVDRRAQSI
jgi:hypothetical protein